MPAAQVIIERNVGDIFLTHIDVQIAAAKVKIHHHCFQARDRHQQTHVRCQETFADPALGTADCDNAACAFVILFRTA